MIWTSKKYSLDKGYPITRLQQCQNSKAKAAKAAKAGASGSCHARDSAATAGEYYSWQPRRLEKKSKDWVESMKSEWGDILSLLFWYAKYILICLSTYQLINRYESHDGWHQALGAWSPSPRASWLKYELFKHRPRPCEKPHPKMTMRSSYEIAWHECEKLLKD